MGTSSSWSWIGRAVESAGSAGILARNESVTFEPIRLTFRGPRVTLGSLTGSPGVLAGSRLISGAEWP